VLTTLTAPSRPPLSSWGPEAGAGLGGRGQSREGWGLDPDPGAQVSPCSGARPGGSAYGYPAAASRRETSSSITSRRTRAATSAGRGVSPAATAVRE